jgi:transposase
MRELYQDRLFSDHMNHPSVVSVGIDVGKAKLDVACVREDRTSIHQVFINTEKGIASLARLLKQQRTAVTVPCVLEATGDYHLLAALMLSKGGYAVKCINPLITKKYCRASVRDAKSDKIDSKRLAEIGLIEEHLPAFADTKDAIAARKLLSSIAHLERVRQQLMGHLQVLEETGKALGIRDGHRDTERALLCIERQIETYRARMCAAAPQEAKALADTMPGLSHEQAAVLLVALGDKVFENRDQLVAFVGLDVRVRQSGKWQGKQILSKRGNGYLRKVLFQIGWSLKMHNEEYRRAYLAMRARGKNYKTCVIAMARKFLRFLFAFYWKRTITPQTSPLTMPAVSPEGTILPIPSLCSV